MFLIILFLLCFILILLFLLPYVITKLLTIKSFNFDHYTISISFKNNIQFKFLQNNRLLSIYIHDLNININVNEINTTIKTKSIKSNNRDVKIPIWQKYAWIWNKVLPLFSFHFNSTKLILHRPNLQTYFILLDSCNFVSSHGLTFTSIITNNVISSFKQFRFCLILNGFKFGILISDILNSRNNSIMHNLFILSSFQIIGSFVLENIENNFKPHFGLEILLDDFIFNLEPSFIDSTLFIEDKKLDEVLIENESMDDFSYSLSFKLNTFKLFYNELAFDINSLKGGVTFYNFNFTKELPTAEFSFLASSICISRDLIIIPILTLENFIANTKKLEMFFELRSINFNLNFFHSEILLKKSLEVLAIFKNDCKESGVRVIPQNTLLKLCAVPYSLNLSVSWINLKIMESSESFILLFATKNIFFQIVTYEFTSNVPLNEIYFRKHFAFNFSSFCIYSRPSYIEFLQITDSKHQFIDNFSNSVPNYDHKICCFWKNASLLSAFSFNFPKAVSELSTSIVEPLILNNPVKIIIENDISLKFGDLNILISIQQFLHLLDLVVSNINLHRKTCEEDLAEKKIQIFDYYCFSYSTRFFLNLDNLFINLSAPAILPHSPLIVESDLKSIETCIGKIPNSILIYKNTEIVGVKSRFCTLSLKSFNLNIDSSILKSLNDLEIISFRSSLSAPLSIELSQRNINTSDICPCYHSNNCINSDFILPEEERSKPLINLTLTTSFELDHWKNSKSILSFSLSIKDLEIFWNLKTHMHLLAFNYFLDKVVVPSYPNSNISELKPLKNSLFLSLIDSFNLRLRVNCNPLFLNLDFSHTDSPLYLTFIISSIYSANPPIYYLNSEKYSINSDDSVECFEYCNNNWPDETSSFLCEWVKLGTINDLKKCMIPLINFNCTNGKIYLNGFDFFNFNRLSISLSRHELNHNYVGIDYSELLNIGLHFNELKLIISRGLYVLDSLDEMLELWKILKKLKLWDLFKYNELKLIETLDLAHFSLKARSFTLELMEEDPLEVVLRSKRRIGLNSIQSDQESNVKRYYSSPQLLQDQVISEFVARLRNKKFTNIQIQKEDSVYPELSSFVQCFKNVAIIRINNFELELSLLPNLLNTTDIFYYLVELDSCIKTDLFDPNLMPSIRYSPQSPADFKELWARRIAFSCNDFSIQLRDFPLPIISTSQLTLGGDILGAQIFPNGFCVCDKIYTLPFAVVSISNDRIGPPLKVYHSLSVKFETPIISYGVGWEPAISAFSLALDRLSSKPVGDSFQFWDNFRYKYHGKLFLSLINSEVRVYSTSSPYDSEHIVLKSSEFNIQFSNANISLNSLDVEFKIIENPFLAVSKNFQVSSILRFPRLAMLIKLEWRCGMDEFNNTWPTTQHYLHSVHQYDNMSSKFELFRAKGLVIVTKLIAKLPTRDNNSRRNSVAEFHCYPIMDMEWPSLSWINSLITLYAFPPTWLIPKKKSGITLILDEIRTEFLINSPVVEFRHNEFGDLKCVHFQGESIKISLSMVHEKNLNNNSLRTWMICGFNLFVKSIVTHLFLPFKSENSEIKNPNILKFIPIHFIKNKSPVYFFSASSLAYSEPIPSWYKKPVAVNLNDLDNLLSGDVNNTSLRNLPPWNVSKNRNTGNFDDTNDFELSQLLLNDEIDTLDTSSTSVLFESSPIHATNVPHLFAVEDLNYSSAIWKRRARRRSLTKKSPVVLPTIEESVSNSVINNETHRRKKTIPSIRSNLLSPLPIERQASSRFSLNGVVIDDELNPHNSLIIIDLKLLWTVHIKKAYNEWWEIFYLLLPKDSDISLSSKKSTSKLDDAKLCSPNVSLSPTNFKKSNNYKSRGSVELMNMLDVLGAEDIIELERSGSIVENNITRKKRSSNICDEILFPSGQSFFSSCSTTTKFTTDNEGILSFEYDFEQKDPLSSLKPRVLSADSSSSTKILFTIELSKPQINFHSLESNSSMILSATSANVQSEGHSLIFSLKNSIFNEKYYLPSVKSHKTEITASLQGVQLFVSPLDIDVNADLLWASSIQSKAKKISQGILRPILDPSSSLVFTYSYDTDLDIAFKRLFNILPESNNMKSFLMTNFSILHSDNILPVSDVSCVQSILDNIQNQVNEGLWKRKLTSVMQLYFPNIKAQLTSEQFFCLINVVNSVLLYDVDDKSHKDVDPLLNDLDGEIPPLPNNENSLNELLKFGLNAKSLVQEKLESNTTYLIRGLIRMVEYGIGNASLTLLFDSGKFMEISLNSLHGIHKFYDDSSKVVLFEITDMKCDNVLQETEEDLRHMIRPVENLWRTRDKWRDRIISMRAEVNPPPLDTFIQQPALRNITFWEHVEVKFFPVEVKLAYNIYPLFIKYIFSDFNKQKISLEKDKFINNSTSSWRVKKTTNPPTLKSISDMFNSSVDADRDEDANYQISSLTFAQEIKNRSESSMAEVNPVEEENMEAANKQCHFFRYLRVGDVDLILNIKSPYLNFTDKPVQTTPFIVNNKLWSLRKLIYKLEVQLALDSLKSITNTRKKIGLSFPDKDDKPDIKKPSTIEEQPHSKKDFSISKMFGLDSNNTNEIAHKKVNNSPSNILFGLSKKK